MLGCAVVLYVGVQPPNEKALTISVVALLVTLVVWFGYERRVFHGPPDAILAQRTEP